MWVRLNMISPPNKQKYQREDGCSTFSASKDICLKYRCVVCKDFIPLTLILSPKFIRRERNILRLRYLQAEAGTGFLVFHLLTHVSY